MSDVGHVVVVGGGIAGLATAHRLHRRGVRVTVLEADGRLGGKIRTEQFAGRPLDVGAEALLTRVPEVLALCHELGLEHELVAPASDQPYVWAGGRLRPLPPRLLSGVPDGAETVVTTKILSPFGLARAGLDLVVPSRPLTHDVSVGQLVRRRLGDQVLERLIDPLLGGIHAGSCDQLSVRAIAPQLEAAVGSRRGLVRGLRAAAGRPAAGRSPVAPTGPAFLSLSGGLNDLVRALSARLHGADVRTGTAVDALEALPDGRVRVLPDGGEPLAADHVVLAVPAFAAAGLLESACPAAAGELRAIDYASVATVLLAYSPDALPAPLAGSGFLVPRGEGRTVTACTWSSAKWSHLTGDAVLLKASVGRAGDHSGLALPNQQLTQRVHAELAEAMGLREQPLEARVVRFEQALPQYRVGHLDRVARIDKALAALPAVRLVGAAYRGVGVGSCIRDGELAAAAIAGAGS